MLKRGELVRLTFAGRTVAAFVAMASENGRSIFLMFDATVGGYVGGMPLMWDGQTFRDFGGQVARLKLERCVN
jgi:hypothetical protein